MNAVSRVEIPTAEGRSFGGPALEAGATGEAAFALATAGAALDFPVAENEEGILGFIVDSPDALANPSHPFQALLPSREGTITYRVEPGDTLSGIAKKFGITLETVLAANSRVRERIVPGQELVILPVSGVLHTASDGDTVESIAHLYGVDAAKVASVNARLLAGGLKPGATLIVPGARRKTAELALLPYRSLPNLNFYFGLPAAGWNWGRIHGQNGVDVANACGTPIYAAAEGLVAKAFSPAKWNGGYGGMVVIEHPNGTETRYAHTEENLVEEGSFVEKGAMIARMGSTGNTHGVTGCHVHYEVGGAQNPLAKQ